VALGPGGGGQLPGQAALAATGRSHHQGYATGAGPGRLPPGAQPPDLLRPTDQLRDLDRPGLRRTGRGVAVGEPGQIGQQALPARVTVIGVLGQQPGHHAGQLRADVGPALAHVRCRGAEVQPDQLAGVRRGERQLAGEALEHHDAQRVQVGAAVHRAVQHAGLLRRGVPERADRPAAGILPGPRGQPEVDHPRGPVRREHDVVRFEVAVHQPGPVRDPERAGDLRRHRHRPLRLQRTTGQQTAQRPAGDELHDEVRLPVGLPHLIDRG
jgi:hypothetical protein